MGFETDRRLARPPLSAASLVTIDCPEGCLQATPSLGHTVWQKIFTSVTMLAAYGVMPVTCSCSGADPHAVADVLQDDGSKVTAEVGLLGGEVNKFLAAYAR